MFPAVGAALGSLHPVTGGGEGGGGGAVKLTEVSNWYEYFK